MRTSPRSTRRTTQPLLGKENLGENTATSSRRARHRLSTAELTRLEDVFRQETHPSRQKKKDLASELGMDYKTVTIWFQNKRQTSKLRGQTSFERERERHQDQDGRLARTRADSSLRNVSSPSHNATLKPDSPGIDLGSVEDNSDPGPRQEDHAARDGAPVNVLATKPVIKIRPLLGCLNPFASCSRVHVEPMVGSTETTPMCVATSADAQDSDSDQQPPQTMSVIPVAPVEPNTDDEVVEQEQAEQVKEKPIRWKSVRTLEWACERQAKRRKLSKDTNVRLELEEVQDGSSDNMRMDSALSLLSLASSTQVGSPEDVMRGASLLLNLKHSWDKVAGSI